MRGLINDKYEEPIKEFQNFSLALKYAKLENEYDIAGISPLLSRFEDIVSIFSCEQNRLIDQIEMLYHKIDTLENKATAIEKENLKISDSSKAQVKDLKAFKENVISVTGVGKEAEELVKRELVTLEKTLNSFESNYGKAKGLRGLVSQLSDTMPKFATIKDEVKTHKNLLSDTKMRLSHSLSQMVHLKKKITEPEVLERFNKSYERVGD